jgi:hypothetical protein
VPKCSHTINICYSFICLLLKSIFNIRSTTISPPNKFFTDLIHVTFLHQNLKEPPILSICSQPTMFDMMPLFYTSTIYGYFPPGSQVERSNSQLICGNVWQVMSHCLCYHSTHEFHTCDLCLCTYVFMCVYVCMVYIYSCVYIHMYICIHVFIYVCVCVYVCIHVFIYVWRYICKSVLGNLVITSTIILHCSVFTLKIGSHCSELYKC